MWYMITDVNCVKIIKENLVYKRDFEVLQPVKKEGGEDGEAGLGGEPEIDYKI